MSQRTSRSNDQTDTMLGRTFSSMDDNTRTAAEHAEEFIMRVCT